MELFRWWTCGNKTWDFQICRTKINNGGSQNSQKSALENVNLFFYILVFSKNSSIIREEGLTLPARISGASGFGSCRPSPRGRLLPSTVAWRKCSRVVCDFTQKHVNYRLCCSDWDFQRYSTTSISSPSRDSYPTDLFFSYIPALSFISGIFQTQVSLWAAYFIFTGSLYDCLELFLLG